MIGATDDKADKVVRTGWGEKRSIYTEDVVATIYSQLGIRLERRMTDTPSGRDFQYLEPMSGTDFVSFHEIGLLLRLDFFIVSV